MKYVISRNFATSSPPATEIDTLRPENQKTETPKGSAANTQPIKRNLEEAEVAPAETSASQITSGAKGSLEVPAPQHQYFLIGGSFRNKDNAEDFRKELIKKGYDARVLHEPDGLHKVSYLTCKNLEKAQSELKKLEEKGIDSWIYQPPANK